MPVKLPRLPWNLGCGCRLHLVPYWELIVFTRSRDCTDLHPVFAAVADLVRVTDPKDSGDAPDPGL